MTTKETLRQLTEKIRNIYWKAARDFDSVAETEVDLMERLYKEHKYLGRMEAINDVLRLVYETIDYLD